MRQSAEILLCVGCAVAWAVAQDNAAPAVGQGVAPAPAAAALGVSAPAAEFRVHGVIRSGGVPLPGVTVTAAHSLSGRKVVSSTGVDGAYRLDLPGKGRWVVRVEFAAFAAQTYEAMLNTEQPAAAHDFELVLVSRVPKAAGNDSATLDADLSQTPSAQSTTHANGNGRGAQRLTVRGDAAALAQAASSGDSDLSSSASGLAASDDATNQSVSVNGRQGSSQDFGVQNVDDLRDRIQELRARGQLGGEMGGPGGGGPGGPGGGGPGMFGGGRMRMGSLSRPHGQIYWDGSNAVFDASPYALSGTSSKPSYGSNKFGASIGGTLKIPHVYDDGGKTFGFLNYSGTRSTTPYDMFSRVPTLAERAGDLSALGVTLYDPTSGAQINSSAVPISTQALALLPYIPLPNTTDATKNYHFSSAADSDQDMISLRLMHNFGATSGQRNMPPPPPDGGGPGGPGMGGSGSRRPRNNLNLGFNYQRNASQTLEPFETVGGHMRSNGFNLNAGWALSRGKLSNQLRFTWNRSRAHTNNYYAGITNVAGNAHITGVADGASDALNWGVPNLSFSSLTSLTDVTPSERDSQTFSLSDSVGWTHKKHHLHFGGDLRWIDNKFYASSNPRGTFTFTGSSTAQYANGAAVAGTGSDLADFLLGYAQSTAVAYSKVHNQFLGNSWDLFVMDDWRVRANLTVNFGLRYEYVTPYREEHNALANLDAGFSGNTFLGVVAVSPNSNGPSTAGYYNGHYGRGLMNPDRNNFAPRVGLAWKPWGNKTVIRAGYGINYNLGQYAQIVQKLAAQPPFAVTETNTAAATGPSTLTMANGFPSSATTTTSNNFGIDPNYRTAYVQMWNLNIQRELTPTLLLNVGYTGSKGTALDMVRAPNRNPDGLKIATVAPFNWETSQGSSILHAASIRLRKRMTHGFSAGGTYTFSKSIDNASSIGGGSQTVAQNDEDLKAERGLSSFDQRHKLTADWMLELPFGEGRKWLTKPGWAQKAFGDWMLESSITAASGTPFTAHVLGSYTDVAGGTNGTLRANYNGESLGVSHRTISQWFNTAAFTAPASGSYGNAGRNTIIGPGSWLMSLVLSKNFPIHESTGLEVRAEADNVLNHANYSGIDSNFNSASYGQVTSVGSMRKMVLSAHYRF